MPGSHKRYPDMPYYWYYGGVSPMAKNKSNKAKAPQNQYNSEFAEETHTTANKSASQKAQK
ncbi:hypothetical protein GCM10010911_35770 [Paenibacillus nasutitermitis]|uniref:Uncharacterized protein n=1 Tax=Paenibacillus nasutitermitis TaxID=1652958 RepID=A0A916Z3N2_9BACL|nr:hypothetical protein GCM10010911_35770 [Paenibacillus nasutitermitis]